MAIVLPSPASHLPPETLNAASPAFIRYVEAAKFQGVDKEQFRRFARVSVVLQPKQLLASAWARKCDVEDGPLELGYGGARGGGKSHWLLAQMAVDDCQRFPGLKCLLLRKVGKANKENFEDLLRRVLRFIPYTYNRGEGILYFKNGSRIVLGHFQHEKDIDAYLGIEYDVIGVEEATTLSSSKYKTIRSCCRTSKEGWRPRMYSTTNPGGVGHSWYKARFVDPAKRGDQKKTVFISATVDDNSFVNKEYEDVLNSFTGWQLRAWRFGDWDIAAGQFFTNFRSDVHVVHWGIETEQAGWRFWGAMDYGWTHYTTFYLMAKDGDGNVICLDEHAERKWLPKRHVDAIKALLERHGLTFNHLRRVVAGGDIFRPDKEGATIAEKYKEFGLTIHAANDDRINGAGEILTRFGDVDAETPIEPRLFIHERCARLIDCIPSLEHDPHRPEDVLKVDTDDDGLGGDDPYDGFRYGVMEDYKAPPEKPTHLPRSTFAKNGGGQSTGKRLKRAA